MAPGCGAEATELLAHLANKGINSPDILNKSDEIENSFKLESTRDISITHHFWTTLWVYS